MAFVNVHNFYFSLIIIIMIKSGMMRVAGNVGRMGRCEMRAELWFEILNENAARKNFS
jgi:hypothetical protein